MVKLCWKGVNKINLLQTFIDLSTSDKIQIISILTSSLLSIISVLIALASLRQTSYITMEANKANIIVYITKNRTEAWPSLVIKNFGNSSGKVLNIEIDPPIYNPISSKKLIAEYTDLFLAPNQSISTIFDIKKINPKVFNIKITYETLGKIYTEAYSINYEYRSSILSSSFKAKSIEDNLEELTKSIREVSDKLN